MVTTFIMQPRWNEAKVTEIESRSAIAMYSAWTAARDALAALDVRWIALGIPYPRAIHARVAPFSASRGYEIVGDVTFDMVKMNEVPKVSAHRLANFVGSLIVHLATDLPTFSSIATIEQKSGLPVLTSNQAILWRTLRSMTCNAQIPSLGKIFNV